MVGVHSGSRASIMAVLIQVLLDTKSFTVSSAALALNSCGLYRRTAVAGSPSRPALPNICAHATLHQTKTATRRLYGSSFLGIPEMSGRPKWMKSLMSMPCNRLWLSIPFLVVQLGLGTIPTYGGTTATCT